jgi:hypothetical protein
MPPLPRIFSKHLGDVATAAPGESHDMDFPEMQDFFDGHHNCPQFAGNSAREISTQLGSTTPLGCAKPPSCPRRRDAQSPRPTRSPDVDHEEGSNPDPDPNFPADPPRRQGGTSGSPRPPRSRRRQGSDGAGHDRGPQPAFLVPEHGRGSKQNDSGAPAFEMSAPEPTSTNGPGPVGRDHPRKRIPCPKSYTRHSCRCSR